MSVIKSAALGGLLLLSFNVFPASLEQNLKLENQTQSLAQASQQTIDKLDNESRELLRQYQQIMQQADYQEAYNSELKQTLIEQQAQLDKLKKQLADVQITRLHIMPFLREKTADLKQLIELDLPFQADARLQAVQRLQALLSDGKASLAEKYRRLMQLWQAESDFSYELNHYAGDVTLDGKKVAVQFLQVGRLALFFQSLDGKKSAYWQADKKQWLMLGTQYNQAIKTAMRVADKQLPPELLSLPIQLQEAN